MVVLPAASSPTKASGRELRDGGRGEGRKRERKEEEEGRERRMRKERVNYLIKEQNREVPKVLIRLCIYTIS